MFRRRRRNDSDEGDEAVEAVDAVEAPDAATDDGAGPEDLAPLEAGAPSVPAAPPGRENGPWDVSEVDDPASGGRVDLGGMWLPGRPGLEVRIEADQATSQVVAVTLVIGDSALQVQPFAAPRTEAIWHEVRDEIRAGITKQGGTSDEVEGPFGTELRTKVPVRAQDGSTGVQPARFLGVDGPRWFLRGPSSPAAPPSRTAPTRARGGPARRRRGPRRGGDGAARPHPARAARDAGGRPSRSGRTRVRRRRRPGPERSAEDLKPFERGPEITEIR